MGSLMNLRASGETIARAIARSIEVKAGPQPLHCP